MPHPGLTIHPHPEARMVYGWSGYCEWADSEYLPGRVTAAGYPPPHLSLPTVTERDRDPRRRVSTIPATR